MILFDNVAARIALQWEVYFMRFLLLLPPEISQVVLPYSRKTLERQLVGDYWLLSKPASQMPKEAVKHYALVGKIFIVLAFWMIGGGILDKFRG